MGNTEQIPKNTSFTSLPHHNNHRAAVFALASIDTLCTGRHPYTSSKASRSVLLTLSHLLLARRKTIDEHLAHGALRLAKCIIRIRNPLHLSPLRCMHKITKHSKNRELHCCENCLYVPNNISDPFHHALHVCNPTPDRRLAHS